MVKEVHASHILVKTEAEAKAALEEIENGKQFSQIAKERSMCPSGKNGGDLGWFKRGQMVKPFENSAFSMKKGEMSAPVKTQFGWHLIKVLETR